MRLKHLLYLIVLALMIGVVGAVTAQREGARPFVGVGFEEAEGGVEITAVVEGSPAAEAGLEVGDIVTAVDGEAVDAQSFPRSIMSKSVGDEVVLTITRDDEEQEITLTLGEAQDSAEAPFIPPMVGERPFLGVRVDEQDGAVTIAEVVPDSPAAEAGLEVGDVVTELNGETVESAQAFVQAIQELEPEAEITLTVQRGEETQEITATLGTAMDMGGRGGRMPFGGRGGGREIFIVPGQFTYLEEESAWEVGELPEDSPFYEAGLRTGDRITAINGETYTPENLIELFLQQEGANVTLTVLRGEETQEIEVDSTILPALFVTGQGFGMGRGGRFDFDFGRGFGGRLGGGLLSGALGAEIVQLNEQTAAEFNITETEGLYVVRVGQGSAASEAGLQARDIITAINGEAITEDFMPRDLLEGVEPGEGLTLTLDVLRDGETEQIEVTLDNLMQEMPGFRFEFPVPDFPEPETPEGEPQQSA
jgi:S1-C subfamily serine protease